MALQAKPQLLASLLLCMCVVAELDSKISRPAKEVSAFVAKAAIFAYEDTMQLRDSIVSLEQQILNKGVSPLESYLWLHEPLGLFVDSAMSSLRHAAAALAGTQLSTERGWLEASSLEEQFASLVSVQSKEPLFFWHGPKWSISTKLSDLIGPNGSWRKELESLASASETSIVDVVGDSAAEEAKLSIDALSVPAFGLAIDDDDVCDETVAAGSCEHELSEALKKVSQFVEKVKPSKAGIHMIILATATREESLKAIGAVLRSSSYTSNIFLSVAVPAELIETQPHTLSDWVKSTVSSLGRDSIDLLWLPYKAFTKKKWQVTKTVLEGLGIPYGIQTEVTNPSVAAKLLSGRQPAPLAWLTHDDLLRPVARGVVAAAHEAKVAPVSMPRRLLPQINKLAGHYLRLAGLVKNESEVTTEFQEALQLRLSWERGLTANLKFSNLKHTEMILSLFDAHNSDRLDIQQSQLLQSLHFTALAEVPKPDSSPKKTSLQHSIQSSSQLLTANRDAAYKLKVQQKENRPWVSGSTLQDMEAQSDQYKANNFLIYKDNFFDADTFAAIKAEAERLWRSRDIEANCNLDGKNRLGGYIIDPSVRNTSFYNLIYGNEGFRRWVTAINDEGPMWASDFPIELREYGLESSGMGCHPDLQMYAVPKKDLEFAFTVDNDSNCKTSFWDASGKQHFVHTKANSMIMVRVNSASHCVSPTEGGVRSMIKFIYVGDYRKSNDFWYYTGNDCGPGNSNRQDIEARRASRVAAYEVTKDGSEL